MAFSDHFSFSGPGRVQVVSPGLLLTIVVARKRNRRRLESTNVGSEIALIDPLAVHDISCLFRLLVDPGVVKVFHAGEQDLEIFHRLLGRPVAPVFDTQITAALLGYGDHISLKSLLQITLGHQLEKEHTFTDWLRRPLSSSQIGYALNDVRHLGRVYELFYKTLQATGRLE